MKELPKRKPNRLKDYDYSQNGAYFITICVKDKHCILWGNNVGANRVRPQLSEIGNIIEKEINKIEVAYENIIVDKFVIMPNHIHLIIVIHDDGDGVLDIDGRTRFAPTVSRIIKQTKGLATKQNGFSIWQRSFHDHIIRNEKDYNRIAEYIENNPANWETDCFYS